MKVGGITGFGGAGKTTIAVNLGVCFAHSGIRTLLIDGDLHFPDMAFHFGLEPAYTLADFVKNPQMDIEWLTYLPEGTRDLYLILGESCDWIADINAFKHVAGLAEILKPYYGLVLVDLPPGVPFEARPLVDILDFQILVINPSRVPLRNALDHVASTIEKFLSTGPDSMGVILNDIAMPSKKVGEIEDLLSEIGIPLIGGIKHDLSLYMEPQLGRPVCLPDGDETFMEIASIVQKMIF